MTPRVCETVTASTTAELRRRRDAVRFAEIVELRLDSLADPDVAGALAGRTRPVIVTCRPTWEGGQFAGSETARRAILAEALARGAEYVDVEWKAGFEDLVASTGGRRVVLSSHDFEGLPTDLDARMAAMRATGAEVVKVAVTPRRLSDCLTLAEAGRRHGGEQRPLVAIAMGARGLVSRVLPGRFGSSWTYAGNMAGIGQVDARTLVEQYGIRRLGEATAVYGLTGSPIGHSVSPAMHNAAFRAAGLDAVYVPFEAADVEDFIGFATAFGVAGASVTIPFKVPVVAHLASTSALAQTLGAVNTLRRTAEGWEGANTDVEGFLAPLRARGVELAGLRAAVAGAGGSSRAVALGLARAGAAITVHARDRRRAADVAALSGGAVGEWPVPGGTWDLLVNCTPIGMHPDVDGTPLPAVSLTGRIVYDLVYNPRRTRLLREAAAAGCETIGGLDMLVAQADEQFRIWTGARPAPGVMRAAAERRLVEFGAR